MDFGLMILRVLIGALLIGHGTQKLYGWFGGYGPQGTGQWLESLGYRPGEKHARLAGTGEALGGALLLLGLMTPFAAAAIIAVMINAIGAVHLEKGMWNADGGMEYPLVLGTAAAMYGFTGPGALSFDNALGIDMAGPAWGFVTIALGAMAGLLVLFSRREDAEAAIEEEIRRQTAA